MPHVPGLRSPYVKVGRLVFFGRMLDKIRLHAAGQLPPGDYGASLGKGFDGRCCNFLRVAYADLQERVLAGAWDDAQLLAWCHERGGPRTDEECEVWNYFMIKRGWRDAVAGLLAQRIKEGALDASRVMTMFDYLDHDEGRTSATDRPWENI